ncbi:MAG: site-2 protease family protein [Gammaproteobacteria bacterium]|nr:site-2 protease family protein [Gammaproteobacteria bacterium]
MDLLYTVLVTLVTLGILVAVHEFGHFWVARRCGVKVLRFSIGFGKALWRRTARDGTEYVIAAVPLGGYVKMLDEREGPVAQEELASASTASRCRRAWRSSRRVRRRISCWRSSRSTCCT